MKTLQFIIIGFSLVSLSACVTTKKYNTLDIAYKGAQKDNNNCNKQLRDAQAAKDQLDNQLKNLQVLFDDQKKQLENAKQGSNQLLNTLQDLSVLSTKQAESVKQSLNTISEKDSYIQKLQSAMARKDSMNMELALSLKSVLRDINDKDINIKVDKGVVYVDISDKMLFNSGQYTVTPQARGVLGKVATVLNAHPDFEFMVEGHTDSVPIHTACMEDNWDLSVKRATSVIRILQNQYHMDPTRMAASGRGKCIPVASNTDAAGRALNRRTRIIILPQLDQFFKLLASK